MFWMKQMLLVVFSKLSNDGWIGDEMCVNDDDMEEHKYLCVDTKSCVFEETR